MPTFQELFEKSAGKPVVYKGRLVMMSDDFPVKGTKCVQLHFEECNGEWRQGVALSCKGGFRVNDKAIKNGLVLWQDTAPQVVTMEVLGCPQTIVVRNVWDVGDGVIHSWHNGAAMIPEPLPTGYRYRCNDGFADEDFDDIVFRLERVVN